MSRFAVPGAVGFQALLIEELPLALSLEAILFERDASRSRSNTGKPYSAIVISPIAGEEGDDIFIRRATKAHNGQVEIDPALTLAATTSFRHLTL